MLPIDISGFLPYLNTVLEDTRYDHDNQDLIGTISNQRYDLRPHEIRSPFGKIAKVDVSLDGATFQPATLVGPNIERSGSRWEFSLTLRQVA